MLKRENKFVKTGSSVKTKTVKSGYSVKPKLNYQTRTMDAINGYAFKKVSNIANNVIDSAGNDAKDGINSTIYAKNIAESMYSGINKGVSLNKGSVKPIRIVRGMASKSLSNMQNKDLGTGINSIVYATNKARRIVKITLAFRRMLVVIAKFVSNPIGLKVTLVAILIAFLAVLAVLSGIVVYSSSNYIGFIYNDDLNAGTGTYCWPVPSSKNITSGYGMRTLQGKTKFHYGIDVSADEGEDIVAADTGKVSLVVRNHKSYGNYLIVDHGNGYETLYAHCISIDATEGQSVQKNDVIAKIGSTGNSTGNHLHFEVKEYGKNINPLNNLFD